VPTRDYATRVLVFITAATLLLAAGCTDQKSATPVPGHQESAMPLPGNEILFSPIPTALIASGNVQYKTLLGPLTGTGTKVFPVPVRHTYMLWLGCRGTGGFAVVESSLLGLNTEMPCETTGRISGYQFSSPHNSSAKMAILRADGPRGARWELRIDAEPQAG
jgi:hypothetical protein